MILSILTFQTPRTPPSFQPFADLCNERYAPYLSQPFSNFGPESWYSAVKPYHSGIFPFLAMDLMILYRGCTSNLFFGHDLLPYSSDENHPAQMDDSVMNQVNAIVSSISKGTSTMQFRGYGNRIDIGLNALSTLYMEILSSLTQVECGVLSYIRQLQFEKYQDPMETKTFGLQKLVAEKLNKSPVAVHKSLRSAKYNLLAETATAMKQLMA
ncbi:hypothetical protein P0Y35_06225 [Kiritimatiellaeota bacterium B1221]|nr:hypothetical protein [Kiritimatiellaeota bacterium B1221]